MSNRLQILYYSYWEHFKYEKDLSLILPIDHPKRIEISQAVKDIWKDIEKEQQNDQNANRKSSS